MEKPDRVSRIVLFGMALCALLPLVRSSLQGYFFHGDNFPLMFVFENFPDNLHVWRHGYMTGLAGLAEYFQTWPEFFLYWVLAKIGVSPSVASRLGYFAILFFLQVAFFKVFCSAFADVVKDRKALHFGGFAGAVFVVFNPYTFNILVGGQPEYLRALAAFLFFCHAVYKLFGVGSPRPAFHGLVCVLSTTLFMGTNYFLSAFYMVACLIVGGIVWVRRRGQRFLFLSLVGLIVLVNLWWAVPFVLINLNSQVIATGMQQINPDKVLQGSSAMNFFTNLRIHYGRLGQMYPAQPELNAAFLGLPSQLCGFVLLFCSLSCAFLYRRRRVFCLVVASAVLLFLQMGGSAVSFSLLWDAVPFFKIFRQPYKFTMVLFLLQGAMLGLFGAWLLTRVSGRGVRCAVSTALCAVIVLNMWPMLSGDLGGILTPLTPPDDYRALKQKIDASSEHYRILSLPQTRGVLRYTWAGQTRGVSFLDRFFVHPVLETKVKTILNSYSQQLIEDNLDGSNAIAAWRMLGVRYVVDRQDVSRNRREISQRPFPARRLVLDDPALHRIMTSPNLHVYALDGAYPEVFSPETLTVRFKPEALPGDDSKASWLPPKFTLEASERPLVESGLHAGVWVPSGASWVQAAGKAATREGRERDFLGLSALDFRLQAPPSITFRRCSPTRFLVWGRTTSQGFPLVLNESFDKGWKVYALPAAHGAEPGVSGEAPADPGIFRALGARPLFTASHSLANGFANLWWITPAELGARDGTFQLMIEYDVQPWTFLALLVSGGALGFLLLWLLIPAVGRRLVCGVLAGMLAVMVLPSFSLAGDSSGSAIYFVNEDGRSGPTFYGEGSQIFHVDGDATVQLKAIARADHVYETTRMKALPVAWETQLCRKPPCGRTLSLDFSDAPIGLGTQRTIVIRGRKPNRQGRMGVLCRARVVDAAVPDESPHEISAFVRLNEGRLYERFTADDFDIVPKDALYLAKRELGLSGDRLWRWDMDGNRLVLQTRVSVPLRDETVMKLVVKEPFLPEAIQFSVGKPGVGGRQAFVLDSQVSKNVRRLGNGLTEITVGFNGVPEQLGLDPEETFILEPLLFFRMSERNFISIAPINELSFQEASPLVTLRYGRGQDFQMEIHLNALGEMLPPTTQILALDLDLRQYDYGQLDISGIDLDSLEEDYRPTVFQRGDDALAEWRVRGEGDAGNLMFRPAALPDVGDREFVSGPFRDPEVSVVSDAPYRLMKGGANLSVSGFFPEASGRLTLTLSPAREDRMIDVSVERAGIRRVAVGGRPEAVFTSNGLFVPAGRDLELVIGPPSDNAVRQWSLSLGASSPFVFASAPALRYKVAPDVPHGGFYAFTGGGRGFTGRLMLRDAEGQVTTHHISSLPEGGARVPEGQVVGFELDGFRDGSDNRLDPRRFPILLHLARAGEENIDQYEWWARRGSVQLAPREGRGGTDCGVLFVPTAGASKVVLVPEDAFLFADALVLGNPLPEGCTLTLVHRGQRIPRVLAPGERRIDVSAFSLTNDLAVEISGLATDELQVLPNLSLEVFGKRYSAASEARCCVYVDGRKIVLRPERIEGGTAYLASDVFALAPGTHSFMPVGSGFFSIESLSVESDGAWSVAEDGLRGAVSLGRAALLLLAALGVGWLAIRRGKAVGDAVGLGRRLAAPYRSLSRPGRLLFWGLLSLPGLGMIFLEGHPDLLSIIAGSLPVFGVFLVLDGKFDAWARTAGDRPLHAVWGNGALRLLLLAVLLILPIALLQLCNAVKTSAMLQVLFHALLLTGLLRMWAGALGGEKAP